MDIKFFQDNQNCYKKCFVCGKQFHENERVFIARTNDRIRYRFVCTKCSSKVFNTLTKENEQLLDLDEKKKIWRYMDLSKFVNSLMTHSLFFSSPREFEDPFECSHGFLKRKNEWDDYWCSYFICSILTAPDNLWHFSNIDSAFEQIERLTISITETKPSNFFVNCWHLNEFESEAMWRIYSNKGKDAIAFQTTIGKLRKELNSFAEVKSVEYVDFNTTFAGPNDLIFKKRKAFEYEHEVRAVHIDYESKDQVGLFKKVDIEALIEKIYVSPYAPKWFFEIVKNLVKQYKFKIDVVHSTLLEDPF